MIVTSKGNAQKRTYRKGQLAVQFTGQSVVEFHLQLPRQRCNVSRREYVSTFLHILDGLEGYSMKCVDVFRYYGNRVNVCKISIKQTVDDDTISSVTRNIFSLSERERKKETPTGQEKRGIRRSECRTKHFESDLRSLCTRTTD